MHASLDTLLEPVGRNKEDTLNRKWEEGDKEEEEEEEEGSGGSSCRETYPIVRLVTPSPTVWYKSPRSPARLEERYKRVATTFIPRADLYLTV